MVYILETYYEVKLALVHVERTVNIPLIALRSISEPSFFHSCSPPRQALHLAYHSCVAHELLGRAAAAQTAHLLPGTYVPRAVPSGDGSPGGRQPL
jgi:hypothetical protein